MLSPVAKGPFGQTDGSLVTFSSLALDPKVLAGLKAMALKPLSPIEAKAIPPLLKNEAIVAVSPTGTGKTLSYLVPIANALAREGGFKVTKAVVVVPTVVLGVQVQKTLNALLRVCKIDGSAAFFATAREAKSSAKRPDVAIVTPGLFKDLAQSINLKDVDRVVFDEGDMILFDGFYPDMKATCDRMPWAKISFFSASLGPQYLTLVRKMVRADRVIDLSDGRINGSNISHFLIDLRGFDRLQGLVKTLKSPLLPQGKGIVFVAKKDELWEVAKALRSADISFSEASGNMDKRAIAKSVSAFSKGETQVLLATDYASRGLDLPQVGYAISYTLPEDTDYYFHRAGRTGRFDAKGSSYVLCGKEDMTKARALQRRGAGFSFLAIKKDGLAPVKSAPQSRPYKTADSDYLRKAIIKAKLEHPKGRVKPGYKKKIKTAIMVAKIKHKKKIIRTNLAKKEMKHGV